MASEDANAIPNLQLRDERLRHRWSQKELADHVGTTAVNVSRWERGITAPGAHFRFQLTTLFGKSASELGLEPVSSTDSDQLAAEQTKAACPTITAPLGNLPHRRNTLFTGREEVLARLHQTLQMGKATVLTLPQALSGLGGVGKTQTVIEYAYRYCEHYQAIFWVQAETADVLVADSIAIARLLDIPEKDEPDQWRVVKAVKNWLNSHTHWLLILDNVEDLALIDHLIPANSKGCVLLTTRLQSFGTLAQLVSLEPMNRDEGTLFILRRAKCIGYHEYITDASNADIADARNITQLMGGLPLALDQAGAYIEETGCGLANYLERFRCQQTALLTIRGGVKPDHPQSVHTTLLLSFELVRQANPAAAALLQLCSFLHSDGIPEEIIAEGTSAFDAPLQSVAADPLQLDAAFAILRSYSLLRRDAATKMLTIHRLVQTVLRSGMDKAQQQEWIERVVRALYGIYPEGEEVSQWPLCQRYLPHVQTCALLVEQWGIAFAEAAHLFNYAATYLWRRAQYTQAEELLKVALNIRVRLLGPEHLEVADLINNLAVLYQYRGDYIEAEKRHQQALAIREKLLGPEHNDVAESLNNLALVYYNQGSSQPIEPLFLRALHIRQKVYEKDHPNIAVSLNSLAKLYLNQGKYQQAESYFLQALQIREKVLGPQHLSTAQSLNGLARLYLELHQYDQAESLLIRTLAIREQALGPEHPDVIETLEYYARLLAATKKDI